MKAKTFDRKLESGADVIAGLDLARSSRLQLAQKRVDVDFPNWTIDRLDKRPGARSKPLPDKAPR